MGTVPSSTLFSTTDWPALAAPESHLYKKNEIHWAAGCDLIVQVPAKLIRQKIPSVRQSFLTGLERAALPYPPSASPSLDPASRQPILMQDEIRDPDLSS